MKLLKRLLSKDFRRMELEIVGLETELGLSKECQTELRNNWGNEKENSKQLQRELNVKQSVIYNLEKNKEELKSKIREQSEADLLFATLKIVNELVYKNKPDADKLKSFQATRDLALSQLQSQSITSIRNTLAQAGRSPDFISSLMGGLIG